MSPASLVLRNIGKAYVKYASELHRFARWFGFSVRPSGEHWAVRNVSFRVARGESMGIIGQNGAGKSTILKIIAGATHATEGRVSVDGSTAAAP